MNKVITRTATLREVKERTITGIACPYDEVIEYAGELERFEQGAFENPTLVKLYHEHTLLDGNAPVGQVEAFEDTDEGLVLHAKLYDDHEANYVYELLQSGELTDLSVSGVPVQMRTETDGAGREITVYERFELLEISLVSKGAYSKAKIIEVRSKEDSESRAQDTNIKKEVPNGTTTMEIEDKINGLAETLEVLERSVEGLANKGDESPKHSNIKSYGAFIKGIAKGEQDALILAREWDGGVLEDAAYAPSWVANYVDIAERPRKLSNAFTRASLPASGMTVDWVELDADTTQAGVQANEGDSILFGNVSVTTKNSGITTIAAGSKLSRQEIERAQVNIVEYHWRALVQKYAALAESRVRTAFVGATAHEVAGDITDADGVTDFIVDSAAHLEDEGASADFIVVDVANFKALAKMRQGDAYLLDRNSGSVNVSGVSGSLYSVPLVVVSGTAPLTVASKDALVTYESGGPARITEDDLETLTGSMGVYGYQAVTVPAPTHLVRLEAGE